MVVAPLSHMPSREKVMDFVSQVFYEESVTAIYRLPGLQDNSWQLVRPFKWQVWALIASSIPISAAVYFAMHKFSNKFIRMGSFGPHYADCLLSFFGLAVAQGNKIMLMTELCACRILSLVANNRWGSSPLCCL